MINRDAITVETLLPAFSVSFDTEAFNGLIDSHGVDFVHYSALPCPIGLQQIFDSRKPEHAQHESCSNGFVYKERGILRCFVSQNSNQTENTSIGRVAGAYAVGSFKSRYEDDRPSFISKNDRLFFKQNITVQTTQVVQASESGFDPLDFPVESVSIVIDNDNVEKKEGVDFVVTKKGIQWIKPLPINPQTGLTATYSIQYHYKPYWQVTDLMHELRFANQPNKQNPTKMPQQARLVREQVALQIYRSSTTDQDFVSKENKGRLVRPPTNIFLGK